MKLITIVALFLAVIIGTIIGNGYVHAQDTTPTLSSRIDQFNRLPLERQCAIIGVFALQGADSRTSGVPLDDFIKAEEDRLAAQYPTYRYMTEEEVAFQRKHVQNGWNMTDGMITASPDYVYHPGLAVFVQDSVQAECINSSS